MQKQRGHEPIGTDPESYGYSISPFNVSDTTIKVTKGRNSQPSPPPISLREKSEAAGTNKKRTSIPKDVRAFLETVFETKRSPNGKERKIIAEKCGLTPLQVRVWFTNKRMRSKPNS
jgi:hypothetical protein